MITFAIISPKSLCGASFKYISSFPSSSSLAKGVSLLSISRRICIHCLVVQWVGSIPTDRGVLYLSFSNSEIAEVTSGSHRDESRRQLWIANLCQLIHVAGLALSVLRSVHTVLTNWKTQTFHVINSFPNISPLSVIYATSLKLFTSTLHSPVSPANERRNYASKGSYLCVAIISQVLWKKNLI